jgi:hypothetical protein
MTCFETRRQIFSRILKFLIITALFSIISISFARKINLCAADLGRHIKNGEIFFKQNQIISSNFYSYTEPDFETLNHHWGSGIIFYLVWKYLDFSGLSVFYIVLNLLTFFLFFRIALKSSDFHCSMLSAVLSIPIFTSRTEIRPEGFSYLFMALFCYFLWGFRQGKFSFRTLLLFLPLIQAVWVNIHIYFFLGPALILFFLVHDLLTGKNLTKRNGILLLAACAVSLLNPFGLKGVLEPFTIFREYGYLVKENQSLIFMQDRFGGLIYLHFEFLCFITFISLVFIILQKKFRIFLFEFLAAGFTGILSCLMVRSFPLFGFFFIPAGSAFLYFSAGKFSGLPQKLIRFSTAVFSIFILGFSAFSKNNYYSALHEDTGIGLSEGVRSSAEFFRKNHIEGLIFNNYDIGGYLIFHLFPEQKVFVDNRPEAYSVSFFRDIYIPMQENEEKWIAADNKYNFNAIYFFRHDLTPWAQPFLIKRLQDPMWSPVFVDDFTLILLKRNRKNEELIKLYELPKSIFTVTKEY